MEKRVSYRRYRTAFVLAFDIQKAPHKKSGFEPATDDLGSGEDLFADLRLEGVAAMAELGIADRIVIVGGLEGRYKAERPPIARPNAIRDMLIQDCGIDASRIDAIVSASNTGGNIAIIKQRAPRDSSVVVTNHYHLPRALLMLSDERVYLPGLPAEAFLLLTDPAQKGRVAERFGGNAKALRDVTEIQGIADMIRGTYRPRTDVPAPQTQWWRRYFA